MATRLLNPKVGDIAYGVYSPQKAGRIVEVKHVKMETHVQTDVRILMPNGTEYWTSVPQDFLALIDDHRKKLRNHEALLARINAMPKSKSAA